ncbi:MAG: hypothetical protein HY288_17540 [Planctomycetia bacterium]|nr:hypothetical protein [Planctomycetia bacterium]
MGCTIQLANDAKRYVCPCHHAAFAFDGQRIAVDQHGRPNNAPRRMDAMECRLVQDETSKEWWVEVKHEKFETGATASAAI